MKINDIYESTTSGSIASVSAPMTTQSRNASIYGGKKAGNLLTGKKTNKKYANSVTESKADRERNRLMQVATDYEERAKKTKDPIKKDHYRKMADDARSKIVEKGHVSESKMKQLAMDIRDMDNGNFQRKYKKSKEQMKFLLGDPDAKKTVHENGYGKKMRSCCDSPAQKDQPHIRGCKYYIPTEKDRFDDMEKHNAETIPGYEKRTFTEAHLEEDDLILVPGQGHRLKSGFIPHDHDRTDHEVEMAKSDLFQAAKNAKQVYELIHDVTEEEGLEGWVQEKIIKANDYLNTIREYLEGKQLQNETNGGVIAAGGVGESLANWQLGIQSIPRTSEWKRKAITAVMPGAMGKEYTFDTEQEAIQHFGKDAWEKIKAGVPTKSGKPWEVIYADDVTEGEGLWANIHAKRERIKHGSGERMRKPGSKGAPSAQDFKDAAKEGVGEKIKGVGKGISDKVTTMTKKSHSEKWYVSGFRRRKKSAPPGLGSAEYFVTNKVFPNKKEALAYIKEKQSYLNSHDNVGYFSLFVNSSDSYFNDEPLFSKIEDPNKNEVQEGDIAGGTSNVKESITKVGTYSGPGTGSLKMIRSSHDPKHLMLVNQRGEVIKSHHGSIEDFHRELKNDGFDGIYKGTVGMSESQYANPVQLKALLNKAGLFYSGDRNEFGNNFSSKSGESYDIMPGGNSWRHYSGAAGKDVESLLAHIKANKRLQDYNRQFGVTNEAQSMGTALKNTLAKAEPGSKLDNSIKNHNRDIKNGGKGTLKNAPTGYHFDSKGYCRLGDK